jgi:hypothetical protein
MSAGTATRGAGSARSRCCGPGKTAGSGLSPPGTWTRVSVLRRAICETWCATGVCCDGSRLRVGASPVGVAVIGATSTCGTADGFACAAAHCRLPRSWDRLSRVFPRSWDHLVASNGNTLPVVPGCPRRGGSSTRVGADRRAPGPVLSDEVSVLGHRPGRCLVGRRCAGAGPDVASRMANRGRGPEHSYPGRACLPPCRPFSRQSSFTSHEWIPEVDVPTAVVITTADNVVPPSRQRRLARAIPHAAVFELIGDHAVILNDSARFAQLLIAASRSVTGAIAGQAVGGEPA